MNEKRCFLRIKIGCALCPREAETAKKIQYHMIKVHDGECAQEALSATEAA